MKNLITQIAKALVDRPEEVKVKVVSGGQTQIFELSVGEGEVGKIIGKEGKTAKAIRQLLQSVATKEHTRAVLEILE